MVIAAAKGVSASTENSRMPLGTARRRPLKRKWAKGPRRVADLAVGRYLDESLSFKVMYSRTALTRPSGEDVRHS